VKQI